MTGKCFKPEFATIGYGGKVCLRDRGGHIIYGDLDKKMYPEYWKNNKNWPHDPATGKELPIYGQVTI